LSFYGYLRGKSLLDGYWERVAKRGKDDSPYRAAFAQIICVADTDAEAEELYAEHCLYFFNRCLHVFPPFADPPGYRTMATVKYGALSQLTRARQKILENLTWKQLVDERFIIAGSPETVRQQLEECIKGLHVGHLFCLFHNGDMPDWKTRHSTKLFAEKVMPHLRDMWPEWKHDEHWWMHPMDDRIRPEERQPGAAKIGAAWPRSSGRWSGRRRARPAACSRAAAALRWSSSTAPAGCFATIRSSTSSRVVITCSRRSGPATASPQARSCSRTCWISRYTAGISSRRWGSRSRTSSVTQWAA